MGTTFYFRMAYKCERSIVFWFFKADYIVGDESVGGLIGHSSGSVSNSYATGAVTGVDRNVGGLIGSTSSSGSVSNSYATGAVTGTGGVGGLIGSSNGSVSNSYATGAVTGTGGVGGLIGSSNGSVSNSYATGAVTGTGGVGGLIGSSNGSVSNSYATGAVTGTGGVGGLIGYSSGSVTGTNYFVDASGGANGLGGGSCSGTCEKKTIAEIKAVTSVTGWASNNWNFGTTTQLPAVLYSGAGCETIILPLTNNINSNDGDASKVDCGDIIKGQR